MPLSRRATILVVDDEITNIEVINEAICDDYEVSFATSGEEALQIMETVTPDLVLLDVVMPGLKGFDVCRHIKSHPLLADVPVIFITGLEDSEDEARGLEIGAIDYVTKPINPAILRHRVRNHVEQKLLRDMFAEMAVTDALTGLHNRRRMEGLLAESHGQLMAEGGWLSLIMMDIDFFKKFNDTYGHPSGDQCLFQVASVLKRAVKEVSGHAARYGGEEFCSILPRCDAEEAFKVAERIRDQVALLRIPHVGSEVTPWVTMSFGVVSAKVTAGSEPKQWIQAADAKLYLAKSEGRNRIETIVL